MNRVTRGISQWVGYTAIMGLMAAGCGDDDTEVKAIAAVSTSTPVVGTKVTLAGSKSKGSATPLKYKWVCVGKPAASKAIVANDTKSIANITPDVVGKYTCTLTVTDKGKKTSKATVTFLAKAKATDGSSIDSASAKITATAQATTSLRAPARVGADSITRISAVNVPADAVIEYYVVGSSDPNSNGGEIQERDDGTADFVASEGHWVIGARQWNASGESVDLPNIVIDVE